MIKGIVENLTMTKGKEIPFDTVAELNLIENLGIEGSPFQGGNRQICIFASEARQWINEQEITGLCFTRFKENILIKDLDITRLKIGDEVRIGEAVIVITATKPCFNECERYNHKLPCLLAQTAYFAVVKQGGIIKVGDSVSI